MNELPADISTAHIANRPMQSLWELGCIHRGEKWRTINLKKYGYTSGGGLVDNGKYGAGDAAILDQVKLGPFTSMRGRVNVNSRSANTWNALGGDVQIGWTFDDLGTGITAKTKYAGKELKSLNPGWATTITTGLDTTPCKSRGAAAEILASVVSDTNATDAGKEELIGKIGNLLTTRPNYFTILVTAQLLGPAAQGTYKAFAYDTGKYGVKKAEQRIMAVVYRDALSNKFKIERLQYIDE